MGFYLEILNSLLIAPILFFFLGITAGIIKSDLKFPPNMSALISLYLIMSIGFDSGFEISTNFNHLFTMFYLILLGTVMAIVIPFLGYLLLKNIVKLDKQTSIALATHYASISIATYISGIVFLKSIGVSYYSYISSVIPFMGIFSLFSGFFIAGKINSNSKKNFKKELYKYTILNGSIVLLVGSLIIGLLTGNRGMEKVHGFFVIPFQGIMCLFLLDKGLIVAKHFSKIKKYNISLFLFGIYMPLISGFLSAIMCFLINIDKGTTFLFAILCASASYVTVPIAMKSALPKARSEIYLPITLAITFPFNIIIGIPIYYLVISLLYN